MTAPNAGRIFSLFALMTLTIIATSRAQAVIPHALRSSLMRGFAFAPALDFSRGLDASAIRPIESSRVTRSEDVARVIPANMEPTSNGGLVATQILDHSINNWLNSEAVRSTSLGRTAHSVEKSLKTDVSFGGAEPQAVKHNLRFQMKAAQTQALLEYSGLTTAQFTYSMAQNKKDLELREPLPGLSTQLVFNHTLTQEDRRETLSLRWNW